MSVLRTKDSDACIVDAGSQVVFCVAGGRQELKMPAFDKFIFELLVVIHPSLRFSHIVSRTNAPKLQRRLREALIIDAMLNQPAYHVQPVHCVCFM
jgi:hypothetical protein